MLRSVIVFFYWMLAVVAVWSADIITPQAQVGTVTETVSGQSGTTANLITSPLTSTVNATAPGGYSGGSSVGYNSSTNTYYFGYTQRTIATTIAINNALQGSGIQVNGVQYGMSYLNGGDSYGTLSMNVNITSNTGTTLHSYNHSFNTQNAAWQQFNQTQTFNNPYELANLGNASMSITGKDSRFWAGYYGPQVKDPYLKLTYGSDPKTYYSIPDDGWVPVALQFGFPFYGNVYTQSYMFSNGVVGFLDPTTHWNSFCCDGVNLSNNPGSAWNFAIYGLQTDLIQANPNAKFYTQGSTSYMKYGWENVNEFGTNNLNTFSITLKPTGYIGIQHDSINVQNHNVTTGIAGNLALGQFSQYYNGPGNVFPYTAGSVISFTGTEVNLCYSNPLSSPSCPGYAAAYYSQQCTINALYDIGCPGYASAYLSYQCSIDSLYSTACPGYEQAYHDRQCSLDPLYMTDCTGYADAYYVQQCNLNALYDVGCTGYAQAYFNQQCSLNGLYDRLCPNYSTAYATKMVLEQQGTASIVATAGVVAANAPSTSAGTVSSDGTVSTSVSSTGNTTVDKVVAAPTSTTNTAAAPQAPVQLVQAAPAPQQQMARQEPPAEKKPEGGGQQAEKKPEGGGQQQASGPQQGGGQQGGEKPQPTNRQALAERRLEAAKQKAIEEGKNLAGTVANAKDLEAQKAVQGVVVAAMNFVPGFDNYAKATVPDVIGYKPFTVYNNQKTVDNARLMRGLTGASDRVHEEIVSSQYNRGN